MSFTFPASFAQRRLWFIDQYEPESALYNVPVALRLRGSLDLTALRHALDSIVARHAALRTSFATSGGEPRPIVAESMTLALPLVELGSLAGEDREMEAQRLTEAEAERPFDLERGPLVRARIFRLAHDDHVLALVVHHIVFDGWSAGVFLRELAALYLAHARGEPPALPELPVQYPDYARSQREQLAGEALGRQLAYWQQQLAGAPALLELPTDRPRPTIQSFQGAGESRVFSAELIERIGTLARSEQATLFMALLASFAVLLSRYSRQTDLVIGSPVAGRSRPEFEGLIGFFANTLALRLDLSGEPSFRQLLRRVREVALNAYSNQDLPFERLVEELNPERSQRHQPLFQVALAFENTPRHVPELPGLTLQPFCVGRRTSRFDLTLFLRRQGSGFHGEIEYRTDLFDAATISRMLGHLQVLLEGIIRDPDRPIWLLPMVAGAERRRLVEAWATSHITVPNGTIASHFEEQVARAPDAIAVIFGEERVTYAELNRRANRLARSLRLHRVGPDVPVGLLLGRSVDLIVGLIAVLKAGGAYLPLDPSDPPERLRLSLAAARPPLVITEARLMARVPQGEWMLMDLDQKQEGHAREPDNPIPSRAGLDHLAYLISTSGSSGVPKCVAVTNRGVLRVVIGAEYDHFGADEVFLQLAPIAFDASMFEIWGALLNGATLVVAPPGALMPDELAELVRRYRITTLWLTAGLFHMVVAEGTEALAGIHQLLSGGDVLSPGQVLRAVRGLPECRLLNGYGPTETTIFATTYPLRELSPDASTVPIGRPIASTSTYVLDRWLQPLPVGIPGELFIGGPGVARGYFGRPALTAERFIPDPVSGERGARLYRTGDRARWLPDGTLEFLGRGDAQVKVRGFRVELGEIEAVLARHPLVQTAIVVAFGEHPEEMRLVAYVMARRAGSTPSAVIDPAALRAYLEERLPEYMRPAAFVMLPAIPLTAVGKVDRRALPPPGAEPIASGVADVAPVTSTEEKIARIWAEVLGREGIGVHDDFFALGGHSLLATQVVSRTRRALAVELPLRAIFEQPTIAGLAARVDAERSLGTASPAASVRAYPRHLAHEFPG
jgi:amino acid adenylation domain-containing protein